MASNMFVFSYVAPVYQSSNMDLESMLITAKCCRSRYNLCGVGSNDLSTTEAPREIEAGCH